MEKLAYLVIKTKNYERGERLDKRTSKINISITNGRFTEHFPFSF